MGDFGEEVHIKKTRKPYKCIFCGRVIPTGNKAHGYDGMWEGDWQNWRCCDMCYEVVMPTVDTGEGISDEDFNYYIEDKGYYDCENGCKNNWGWGGVCSWHWSEDKQHMIFTCKKCGHERIVDYPYEPQTEVLSKAEITERLRQSMESSPIRTDKEAAREFLSKLSMYDKNGQLIKDVANEEKAEQTLQKSLEYVRMMESVIAPSKEKLEDGIHKYYEKIMQHKT